MTIEKSPALSPTDPDFLREILSRALKSGASDAQIDAQTSRSRTIELRDGLLQGIDQAESGNIKLTTYMGKRRASLSTNKFDRTTIGEFVERVIGMTRLAIEDPFCGLAPSELIIEAGDDRHLDLCDPGECDIGALTSMAAEVEIAARAVPNVTATQGASAFWKRNEGRILTSGGLDRRTDGTFFYAGVSVIAGSGERREVDGAGRSMRWRADLPPLTSIGREAGNNAAAKLGARKIWSRKAPVIFDQRVAMSLIGPFLGAIAGQSIARRTSFLQEALGERVFPKGFTLSDNPFLPRGHASRACDAEGIVPIPRALVDDGVLTTWLVDCAVARELGISSTGHAGGPTNLTVLAGDRSQRDLMRDAGEGLLVTGLMGPSLNPHTGDWSVGVSGQWFENGEIAFAVSEITIAGCLPDLYKELVRGSDLEMRGATNAPSLLVPQMTMGGT